jgi:hypothetical protein
MEQPKASPMARNPTSIFMRPDLEGAKCRENGKRNMQHPYIENVAVALREEEKELLRHEIVRHGRCVFRATCCGSSG